MAISVDPEPVDPAPVDPAPVDPIIIDPIPKQLKLLLIEMLEHVCLVAARIDISDPTIRSSLDAFKAVLKNLETL